jgi:hypothetical protein
MAENPYLAFASPVQPDHGGGSNPYLAFASPKNDDPAKISEGNGYSLAAAPFAGFNRGLANTIGAPVDAANWAMRKAGMPVSNAPFGGSESIKRGLGVVGANPDMMPAHSGAERLLQSAGEGAGSMIAPEFAVQGGLRAAGAELAPRAGRMVDDFIGSGRSAGASAANAAAGASGAVAGELAQESVPDKYKPLAGMVGSLAGGIGVGAGMVGARAAATEASKFLEPMTNAGRQAAAARTVKGAFSEPYSALDTLENWKTFRDHFNPNPNGALGEVVPGSKPTTGQLTGDRQALSLERELATKTPESYKSNEFGTGSEQQNAARLKALDKIQAEGSPEAVSTAIKGHLAQIEATHDAAISTGLKKAQAAAGSIGSGQSPEAMGGGLRDIMQGARDTAKQKERALWKAVDPEGTLSIPSANVTASAGKIARSMPSTAKPLSGEEAAIFDVAGNLPKVTPFSDFTALRSRISSAMREELIRAGQSDVYRRLTQLRGSIEQSINAAAEHVAAQDRSDVASGSKSADETLAARMEDVLGSSRGVEKSGEGAGASAEEARAASSPGMFGGDRDVGKGQSGLRASTGGQGIPGNVAGDQAKNGLSKVYHPAGSLDVRYELADLPNLVTSHDAAFNKNPNFPQELQPRARESAPAQDQVNSMSARIEPERLGQSPEANSGAPIVGPDNVVESGNGRTLALVKAYQSGRAGDYRNWLESQGFDTAGMKYPALIARRVSEMTPAEREAFAHSANSATGLRMNAAEQAASDAKLITPDVLSAISEGGVTGQENRGFIRSFLARISPTERGGMLDADGNLSQSGVRRVEAAMASRAYGDADFVARAFDAADPNIKGLSGAMVDTAGAWAKMRQMARDGSIDPEHDITPDLMSAVRSIMRARAEGRPAAEILNQGDMFGGEASQLAKRLVLKADGSVGSRQQIADNLGTYAEEAMKNAAGPSLFGDKVFPIDVLKASLAKNGETAPAFVPVSKSMQPEPAANFDAGAANRLRAASTATKERASTFDQGPVGSVLKKGGGAQDYRLSDAQVPQRLFVPGPAGAQTVESFMKAAGSSGLSAISDAAAESLARAAKDENGSINPAKYAAWANKHQDALRAMPDSLRKRFSTAAAASQAVDDAMAARKVAVDDFHDSAVKKLLGVSDAADVTKTVGGILTAKDGVKQMRRITALASSNPAAVAGLRKSVADTILARAKSVAENGASGDVTINAATFQKFIRDNAATIKAAGFSDKEYGFMTAIAADLKRSQRTLFATKLPGQSNTAQDVIKTLEAATNKEAHFSLLQKLSAAFAGGLATHGATGAATLSAAVVGQHLLSTLRQSGIDEIGAMVREAILNPEAALVLLRKAPVKGDTGAEVTLRKALARNLTATAINNNSAGQEDNAPRELTVRPNRDRTH